MSEVHLTRTGFPVKLSVISNKSNVISLNRFNGERLSAEYLQFLEDKASNSNNRAAAIREGSVSYYLWKNNLSEVKTANCERRYRVTREATVGIGKASTRYEIGAKGEVLIKFESDRVGRSEECFVEHYPEKKPLEEMIEKCGFTQK